MRLEEAEHLAMKMLAKRHDDFWSLNVLKRGLIVVFSSMDEWVRDRPPTAEEIALYHAYYHYLEEWTNSGQATHAIFGIVPDLKLSGYMYPPSRSERMRWGVSDVLKVLADLSTRRAEKEMR